MSVCKMPGEPKMLLSLSDQDFVVHRASTSKHTTLDPHSILGLMVLFPYTLPIMCLIVFPMCFHVVQLKLNPQAFPCVLYVVLTVSICSLCAFSNFTICFAKCSRCYSSQFSCVPHAVPNSGKFNPIFLTQSLARVNQHLCWYLHLKSEASSCP